MSYVKVPVAEAKRFVVDCLKAVGANDKAAKQQADMLIIADMSLHQSHGIQRLGSYVSDVKKKICQPNNTPIILKDGVSTAWVDACNCFGSTVSEYAVDLAMKKAARTGVGWISIKGSYVSDVKKKICQPNNTPIILKDGVSTAWVDACNCFGSTVSEYAVDLAMKKAARTGVGWISIKGSNHNGMIGYYAKMCALKGFIGIYFTNTSPLLVPTRSKKAVLGTNPLALVAPACNGEFFHLEMATTATAFGQIEMRLKQGREIPLGLALDSKGQSTTDAKKAVAARLLMPLGGAEETGGYKGYGLSAMVEVLCGICAGSNYGQHVRSFGLANYDKPANLGQCCIAVNPSCFAPGFSQRLSTIMKFWRSLEPVNPKYPVEAPGDMEKNAVEEVKKKGGIMYLKNVIDNLNLLAKELKVQPMKCAR